MTVNRIRMVLGVLLVAWIAVVVLLDNVDTAQTPNAMSVEDRMRIAKGLPTQADMAAQRQHELMLVLIGGGVGLAIVGVIVFTLIRRKAPASPSSAGPDPASP